MKSLSNWHTTLFGGLAAVLNLVANGMTWKAALFSVAIASFGVAAKDGSTGSAP